MASPGDGGDGGVRNDLGGTIAGSSVQAGVVHGDVHFHHATPGSAESARVVPAQLPGTVVHFANRDVERNALTALLDAARGANTMVISGARECWQQAFAILDDVGHPEADEVRSQLSELPDTTT